MRSIRVLTNESCDLHCGFCDRRRPHERADVAGSAALKSRLSAALGKQPARVLLTGGEPTLRKDLPSVVAYARRGDAEVWLETHGLHLDAPRLGSLIEAGLSGVLLHVPAWADELDAFVGQPGAGDALAEVLQRLRQAPVQLEIATPIVAANVEGVAQLPAQLAAAGLRGAQLWFRIPTQSDAGGIANITTATAAATAFIRAATRHGLTASADPASFLPPCLFPRPAQVAPAFALNTGARDRDGYQQRPLCRACVVADRCPGLPTHLDASQLPPQHRPLQRASLRRRLTIIGTPAEQIQRELVTHEVQRRADGHEQPSATVRLNFRCNQSCQFCFVSTHLPDPKADDVEQAIDAIASVGGVLAISGGEPTLHPHLLEYVRRAKSGGAREIELQTNATRLHLDGLAAALETAGLDRAFISLHGNDAATSEAITEAPGTHADTLAGIDAVHATGVEVRLNYVLCAINYAQFPAFVGSVAARWPRASINVSFVGPSTDLVPRTRALIPRYQDVMPSVSAGLAVAAAAGVTVDGFDSMCGIPLCLVPVDPTPFAALAAASPGASSAEFIKTPTCDACRLSPQCFGLRRGYAELHGTSELRAIAE